MVSPKVTIGVCVRNGALTIREAIESIICQDYPHEYMEVIFVDDGSQDATLSIINSYVPVMDMAVKVFHHEWKGLGPSRNVVVNNAEGDYIIWVDGDMILPKDHVLKQVEFIEKNPRVGIGKAKCGLMPRDNLIAYLENIPYIFFNSKNGSRARAKLPGTGGAIFRVEAIRQVSGFDDNLKGVGEDQDIAQRIMLAGWLIKKSSAFFFERREETWSKLWEKYVWYGYGNFFLYQKHKEIFRIYKMIPVTGFLNGLLLSFPAYRITRRKAVFLLPLHFAFKSSAWCHGFIKGALAVSLSGEGVCI